MLSRFTKLPGISTFLGNGHYPQEAVDEAISEIKSLGKSVNVSNDESLQDISKILVLMKRYGDSLHVQRVACHALSNLAMQVRAARWIIQKGGFNLIRRCIAKFNGDHKLCWLASSAVWNLGRPPANRAVIGKEGVRLMLKILYEHRNREKVANTAVGALSNLSLQEELKEMIAEEESLHLLIAVMSQHLSSESTSVLTSSAGLLANLAVSDDFASAIVKKGALSILMKLLMWDRDNSNSSSSTGTVTGDDTLYRNTCAALNNLVTAQGFLDAFLRARGIEFVQDFLKHNNNELYTNLLENCLVNIDADTDVRTSSLHLAAFHGKLPVIKDLYFQDIHETDLDSVDGHRRTLLDYAIAGKHKHVIDFLCMCGAKKHGRKEQDMEEDILDAIQTGTKKLVHVQDTQAKTMIVALPHFPEHLCEYMTGFQHHVDMLKGMNFV
jgi:hypothetical protein